MDSRGVNWIGFWVAPNPTECRRWKAVPAVVGLPTARANPNGCLAGHGGPSCPQKSRGRAPLPAPEQIPKNLLPDSFFSLHVRA